MASLPLKIIDHCHVSPPPKSTPSTSLPLTFLDIPWLFFSPSQPLFFFDFPYPTSHFTTLTLPNLKHSLSLTLQHYYPFAGNLVLPPHPSKPNLIYTNGNSVSLTIAESDADFNHLSSYHPRHVNQFHLLVPKLKPNSSHEKNALPLLAIQVTIFPNSGICIGMTYLHVVADLRTFSSFIKTWASYATSVSYSYPIKLLPFFNRDVIVDVNGLEETFLNQWWKRGAFQKLDHYYCPSNVARDFSNMFRATFVVSLDQMEKIREWIVGQSRKNKQCVPTYLSKYVLTCAFVWVCLLKAHQSVGVNVGGGDDDPCSFGFVAGGMTRMGYVVPVTYFGNCVGFGRVSVSKGELLGEDGIVVAARALGDTIKKLDRDVLDEAENWISDWDVLFGSDFHVVVLGSPKVDLYSTDFGLGKPKKIEDLSIEGRRAISLTESRDLEGGIEVGIALHKTEMDIFTMFFTQGLQAISFQR